MTPLRSVNKGAFLLAREGVISPIRANYMVKFYFLNHYNSGATWGLKAAPDPNAFENKSTPPPPQNSWIRLCPSRGTQNVFISSLYVSCPHIAKVFGINKSAYYFTESVLTYDMKTRTIPETVYDVYLY